MKKRFLIAIIIIVAGGGFYYFNNITGGAGAEKKAKTPEVVGIAQAKTQDITLYLNGLGSVTPYNIANLHSRVDGQIMRVLFKEGQNVGEGELLLELDDRSFQANLLQAEGEMLRNSALLADARLNLARYKTLLAQDSISKQQVDTQASLVKQYEGAVKNDEGQVAAAKLQISYSKITAPFSGRIGLRQFDVGNIIKAGDSNPIAVITQLQPISVIFTVAEDNISKFAGKLNSEAKLPVEAWDRDNKNLLASGFLAAIDNQVDSSTGTIKLKAEFANQNNALFPGQFVNIKLAIDSKKDAVVIPAAGVQNGGKGSFAYVVGNDKVIELRNIKTGVRNGDNISVEEGLKVGENVVIDGIDRLKNGSKVEISAPPTADESDSKANAKHGKNRDN